MGSGPAATVPPSPSVTVVPPTFTSTPTPIPYIPTATITPTFTPSIPTNTPTITLTPSFTLTPTPHPPIPVNACKTCQPWFRASPGTTGHIIKRLDDRVTLSVVGRTADNTWAQANLPDGRQGWVSTHFLDLTGIDLNVMPVTGTAVDASPTPTYAPGAPRVVSGVTSHARDIFLKGKAMGNRANVFAKVGDSITATPIFMNPFGEGQYDLGDYPYLGDVIDFYEGGKARDGSPFVEGSMAAGNGWSTVSLLTPGYSHPEFCGNFTPVACEYAAIKPAVALIMIGSNDAGGVDPAVYQANLQSIVQTSIDMGVIPVLTTLPPKHLDSWNNRRIDQFNSIIRVVAQQNDIPLIDYWFALQTVPNQGISGDGVHPSFPVDGLTVRFSGPDLERGYVIRNLTALQMLDALWRSVLAY